MPTKKGFQVDQRVGIAIDALTAGQKAALEPVLQSKQRFVAHSKLPGVTKKLPGSKLLYTINAGSGHESDLHRSGRQHRGSGRHAAGDDGSPDDQEKDEDDFAEEEPQPHIREVGQGEGGSREPSREESLTRPPT